MQKNVKTFWLIQKALQTESFTGNQNTPSFFFQKGINFEESSKETHLFQNQSNLEIISRRETEFLFTTTLPNFDQITQSNPPDETNLIN